MIVPRVIAFALSSALAAAPPPAPQVGQQPTNVGKPQQNNDDKVSCRVIPEEGTSLKRICMTNAQWKKAAAQTQDVDESGMRNSRCTLGAC